MKHRLYNLSLILLVFIFLVPVILIPGPPESTLEIRRHSGRFLTLIPAQQQKLDQFVQFHSNERE